MVEPGLGGRFWFKSALAAIDASDATYKERIGTTPWRRMHGERRGPQGGGDGGGRGSKRAGAAPDPPAAAARAACGRRAQHGAPGAGVAPDAPAQRPPAAACTPAAHTRRPPPPTSLPSRRTPRQTISPTLSSSLEGLHYLRSTRRLTAVLRSWDESTICALPLQNSLD
jgi:hypothetical protein